MRHTIIPHTTVLTLLFIIHNVTETLNNYYVVIALVSAQAIDLRSYCRFRQVRWTIRCRVVHVRSWQGTRTLGRHGRRTTTTDLPVARDRIDSAHRSRPVVGDSVLLHAVLPSRTVY